MAIIVTTSRKKAKDMDPEEKRDLKRGAFERYFGKNTTYSLGNLPQLTQAGYACSHLGRGSLFHYRERATNKAEIKDDYSDIMAEVSQSLGLNWRNYESSVDKYGQSLELWNKEKPIFDSAPAIKHRRLITQTFINSLGGGEGGFKTNYQLLQYSSEKGAIFVISGTRYTSGGQSVDYDTAGNPGFDNKNSFAIVISTCKSTDNDATAAANFIDRLGGMVFLRLEGQNPQKKPGLHYKPLTSMLKEGIALSGKQLDEANGAIATLNWQLQQANERIETLDGENKQLANSIKGKDLTIESLTTDLKEANTALQTARKQRGEFIDKLQKANELHMALLKSLEAIKNALEKAGRYVKRPAINNALKEIKGAMDNASKP